MMPRILAQPTCAHRMTLLRLTEAKKTIWDGEVCSRVDSCHVPGKFHRNHEQVEQYIDNNIYKMTRVKAVMNWIC